jgi:hypothetical protein
MATIGSVASVASKPQCVPIPKREPITRLIEDERRLAFCLMLPAVVLPALFIPYPFFTGILLAVTDTRADVPGQFVGTDNFVKIWNDDIFQVAVWSTCVYRSSSFCSSAIPAARPGREKTISYGTLTQFSPRSRGFTSLVA